MKAATYQSYGAPEVVTIVDQPIPTPGAGEVLVKVHATTVTSGDARMRAFDIPPLFKPFAGPVMGWPRPRHKVLGYEFAGTVAAIGDGVTTFSPGDAVFGAQVYGGHAEYRTIRAKGAIVAKPEALGFEEAAALPFGGNTALSFLEKAGLKAGQTILVTGGAGAVGNYAVQLARHLGATVTATCGPANAELVASLGASRVIDYTAEPLTGTYDVVFDAVGALGFAAALPLLAPAGAYIANVMAAGDLGAMLWPPARQGRRIVAGDVSGSAADLQRLAELAVNGAIRPLIGRRFAFDDIRAAYAYVDSRHKVGAAVVTLPAA